ncbi:curli synthesis inhibitor [Salmonella enterica]
MKAIVMAMILACLLPPQVLATTLHLSGEIDLLVLDGKKVSSTLVRGAESIELENGPHQVVFRVEKTIDLNEHEQRRYISPPLIASFDTRRVEQVNFSLPGMNTQKEAEHFIATPRVALLDGNANPIPVRLDRLDITPGTANSDYEHDIERYNQSGKIASLPQLKQMMVDDSSLLSAASELDVPPSQNLTEQRLKYWYQKADPTTRNRFMHWAQQQPPS